MNRLIQVQGGVARKKMGECGCEEKKSQLAIASEGKPTG
jgi:hypothetical protein